MSSHMSYPIAKLSPRLFERFNELATPVERYRIQVAAGSATCPAMLQTVESAGSLSIFRKDGALVVKVNRFEDLLPFDNSKPYQCNQDLVFDSLNESDLTMEVVTVQPIHLTIAKCDTTSVFIEKAAYVTRANVNKLTILGADSSTICLSTVFKAFPDIEKLYLGNVMPTSWTPNLKPHQTTKLQELVLHEVSTDGFNICEFAKKQSSGFNIRVDVRY